MADSGQLFPIHSLTRTKPEGWDRYYHQETRPQDLQVASSPRVTQLVIGKGMLGCWALTLLLPGNSHPATRKQGCAAPNQPSGFFQTWLLPQVSQLASWNLETRPDDPCLPHKEACSFHKHSVEDGGLAQACPPLSVNDEAYPLTHLRDREAR